ncbi:unnamed protein product [Euphydryas editha]|uniref:Uncharacterized protein n=1 Tax=Euphydryas editha TaxID=104508 RepID=A0AAU9U2W8_EUPED|nr:unnamed protein product [Euphydryas editha]
MHRSKKLRKNDTKKILTPILPSLIVIISKVALVQKVSSKDKFRIFSTEHLKVVEEHFNEVEIMYEDISKVIHGTTSAFYDVVMGEFNAKVEVQNRSESKIGCGCVVIQER